MQHLSSQFALLKVPPRPSQGLKVWASSKLHVTSCAASWLLTWVYSTHVNVREAINFWCAKSLACLNRCLLWMPSCRAVHWSRYLWNGSVPPFTRTMVEPSCATQTLSRVIKWGWHREFLYSFGSFLENVWLYYSVLLQLGLYLCGYM